MEEPGGVFYVVASGADRENIDEFARRVQRLISTDGPNVVEAWVTVVPAGEDAVAVQYEGYTLRAASSMNMQTRQFLRRHGMEPLDTLPSMAGTAAAPRPRTAEPPPPSAPPPASSAPAETQAEAEDEAAGDTAAGEEAATKDPEPDPEPETAPESQTPAVAAAPPAPPADPSARPVVASPLTDMAVVRLCDGVLAAIASGQAGSLRDILSDVPRELVSEVLGALVNHTRLAILGGTSSVRLGDLGRHYFSPPRELRTIIVAVLVAESVATLHRFADVSGGTEAKMRQSVQRLVDEDMVRSAGYAPKVPGRRGSPPFQYALTARGARIGREYRPPQTDASAGWGSNQTPERLAVLAALMAQPDGTTATAHDIAQAADVSLVITTAILLEGVAAGLVERQLTDEGEQQAYLYQFMPVGRGHAIVAGRETPQSGEKPGKQEKDPGGVFRVTVEVITPEVRAALATLSALPGVKVGRLPGTTGNSKKGAGK